LVGIPGIEEAKAMADEIRESLGLEVDIPALKVKEGWDDYGPVFTAQYFYVFGGFKPYRGSKTPQPGRYFVRRRRLRGAP
jgi:hypothetical protein